MRGSAFEFGIDVGERHPARLQDHQKMMGALLNDEVSFEEFETLSKRVHESGCALKLERMQLRRLEGTIGPEEPVTRDGLML